MDYLKCHLEKVTGKTIVIAAVQKYSYKGDEYCGRKIYYNRTLELIYHVDMANVHGFSAFCFAVLTYEPLLFVTRKDEFLPHVQRDT